MIYYLPTPQGARLQRSLRPRYQANYGPDRLNGRYKIIGVEWHKGKPWLVLDFKEEDVVVLFDDEELDYMETNWIPFNER